jgi:hypothetical protein
MYTVFTVVKIKYNLTVSELQRHSMKLLNNKETSAHNGLLKDCAILLLIKTDNPHKILVNGRFSVLLIDKT